MKNGAAALNPLEKEGVIQRFEYCFELAWKTIKDCLEGGGMFDTELASGEGVARTVNDCCCGTGGRLTLSKDRIQQFNPQAKVFLYGQELNPQTWAIARSDMLILEPEGKDAENIKLGSTLSVCLGFLMKRESQPAFQTFSIN